jgi:hypothetical protein
MTYTFLFLSRTTFVNPVITVRRSVNERIDAAPTLGSIDCDGQKCDCRWTAGGEKVLFCRFDG